MVGLCFVLPFCRGVGNRPLVGSWAPPKPSASFSLNRQRWAAVGASSLRVADAAQQRDVILVMIVRPRWRAKSLITLMAAALVF
ncbi:hypothetical protein WI665_12025 [Vibrio cholerae]